MIQAYTPSRHTFTEESETWQYFEHCDQQICTKSLSRCMFFKKCDCDDKILGEFDHFTDTTCYKDCEKCLNLDGHNILEKCCECLGDAFCGKYPDFQNGKESSKLIQFRDANNNRASKMGNPEISFKMLFSENMEGARLDRDASDKKLKALGQSYKKFTSDTAPLGAVIETFSVDFEREDQIQSKDSEDFNLHSDSFKTSDSKNFKFKKVDTQDICTIAHINMDSEKNCQDLCFEAGSKSARFFSEFECCQCIGPSCLGFGSIYQGCDKEKSGVMVRKQNFDYNSDGEDY